MKDSAQLLKEHFDRHPAMEVRDAVKFLYQRHMGPGHLVANETEALARLEAEWTQVVTDSAVPLYESLGNGLYRLHLSACKGIGLSAKTVCRLFVLTAQQVVPDQEGLKQDLPLVEALPFPREISAAYLAQYRAEGCPMVSHSPAYRAVYFPAYRIVSERYMGLIPLLAAIDRLTAEQPRVRVALDGPCASGKSTVGEALAQIYCCPLIHMDDFFLRPEQRTPQQLAQPGGNIDYERFQTEVLSPLLRGETAHYRPWQCRTGAFGPEITVEPGPLTIVEGSYSLRPDLRKGYHLRVWVEAPWPVREARLRERGGPGCLDRFLKIWIPLENRYFDDCRVQACCHLALSGNGALEES